MNTTEIRKAASDYIRGRSILRTAFPELSVEALDTLALVIADDAPVSALTARERTPRQRSKRKRTRAARAPQPDTSSARSRSTLEVDVGSDTRIRLLDAVIGVFQQKARGVELTLSEIVEDFKAFGWKVLTRNPDWTFPIRELIKREGGDVITWRRVRAEGQRHGRDVFALSTRNVALSPFARSAIDASVRQVVQHISTVN